MEINLVVIQMDSKTLTDHNFDAELVAPNKIVLVIFYDANCSNHYLIEPGLAKLDDQYNQQVKFCRINTRENPKTAKHFRVFVSPTILFFQDGKLVESMAGTFPRVEVENMIQKLITKNIQSNAHGACNIEKQCSGRDQTIKSENQNDPSAGCE